MYYLINMSGRGGFERPATKAILLWGGGPGVGRMWNETKLKGFKKAGKSGKNEGYY